MAEPVSVIIPTFNRADWLGAAIDSVLAQTMPAGEIIVVDDGSTDGTAVQLQSFGARVSVIRQNNQGPAAARNSGIRAARFDLLAFLDSDDRFTPDKLALQTGAMAAHPQYLVSHTEETWFRRGQHLNQKKKHRKGHGDLFAQCLELCAVGMSTAMVRRELFERVGGFNEEMLCCEDYDFWLRVSVRYPFLLVAHPLTVKHGGRPDQVSVIHRQGMDRWRIASLQKLLESAALSAIQEQLARTELVKKCTIYGTGCLKHGKRQEGELYLAMAKKNQ